VPVSAVDLLDARAHEPRELEIERMKRIEGRGNGLAELAAQYGIQ
jgi:hypothetical protein